MLEEALIHEFHFQRERIVDINAAVVGISSSRWTKAASKEASIEQAQEIMQANGFDVLPIDDGQRVRGYFNTQEWGNYTSIKQETINYRDVISYQTSIREVVKGFAMENRYFYFLESENRTVGLVTIANLNCRQMQIYLFSLFCELETALATYLSLAMSQVEIKIAFSQTQSPRRSDIDKRHERDSRQGVDAPYVEYLYFSDLLLLIDAKQLAQLGISPTRQTALKELTEWRNRVAHPTKSLIRRPDEVGVLWQNLDLIEEVLFQLRHSLKEKQ